MKLKMLSILMLFFSVNSYAYNMGMADDAVCVKGNTSVCELWQSHKGKAFTPYCETDRYCPEMIKYCYMWNAFGQCVKSSFIKSSFGTPDYNKNFIKRGFN